MHRSFIYILSLLIFIQPLCAQNHRKKEPQLKQKPAEEVSARRTEMSHWVDSVANSLTLEEKIAQLLIVRVPLSSSKDKVQREFEKSLQKYNVGGLCFFKGTAADQLQRTRRYQRMVKTPMLVSIDGEWGLGMRLTDCYSFPRQMMMGALNKKNDSLIYVMGCEVARQCCMMGIHIDFAPCVDLNNNSLNPVIGARSFGEDKVRVAEKAIQYMRALQQGGVMAVAKHFPGHGDTDADSHTGLPTINHTRGVIDTVDTYPFRRLAQANVRGIMVAHLQVKALDRAANTPSSTSELIVNQLLRKQIGYKGLIFTDGMDMGAITKNFKKGEGERRALIAGADIILLPSDIEATINAIKTNAESDSLVAQLIEIKCRSVLRAKYRMGLNRMDLNALSAPTRKDQERCKDITRSIASKALTLVRNENEVLPFTKKDKVVSFAIGKCDSAIHAITDDVAKRMNEADKVLLHLHASVFLGSAKNYGFSPADQDLVQQIVAFNPNTVLVIYGSPYILKFFSPTNAPISQLPAGIVVAYEDMAEVNEVVPDALWGKTSFEGVLPISINKYHVGMGLSTKRKVVYDPYAEIRKMNMDVACFRKIDSIAQMGVDVKAYPGCQILVARKGKVVYHRGYGRQTYDASSLAVDTNTIYDLASLTKVTATTFAVMKLVDDGKVKLDDPLSLYLPYLKHTNKKKITVKECLSHIAQLKAFDAYYKNVPSGCENLGIDPQAAKCEECSMNVLVQIAGSKLNKEKKYLYSDLGFILLADMVRSVTGQTIDIFMNKQFYQPMGLKSTTYLPRLNNIDTNLVAPTEKDTYFRHRQLRAEVQDQNAAAMGGVAGHAGLFSRCADINCLYQMMLNGGMYKGKRYLSEEVIQLFNQRHFTNLGNRRALGYDKPFIHGKSTHVAPEASQLSFGHTGYTGTMVWVDPKYDLVYIFLSNRVYPSVENTKLANLNIRTDIQSLIYQSIIEK